MTSCNAVLVLCVLAASLTGGAASVAAADPTPGEPAPREPEPDPQQAPEPDPEPEPEPAPPPVLVPVGNCDPAAGCASGVIAPTTGVTPRALPTRYPFWVLQLNLCNSGVARCY